MCLTGIENKLLSKFMFAKWNWKKFNCQLQEMPRCSNKYPNTTPILVCLSPSLFLMSSLFEVNLDLLAHVWTACFTFWFTSHLTSESSNCACLLRLLQLLHHKFEPGSSYENLLWAFVHRELKTRFLASLISHFQVRIKSNWKIRYFDSFWFAESEYQNEICI